MTSTKYHPHGVKRMTYNRKREILEHIERDPEAQELYELQYSREEIQEWKTKFGAYGKNGLRATRRNS